MMLRRSLFALTLLGLGACDPVTLSLVTAGGGVAFNHQMSSTITRTFSEESGNVHGALLAALDRMSIVVKKREQQGEVETIHAVAGTRDITLRVEPVTRTSTLLEVAVHQDLLTMDGATAREIVAQTERALSPAQAAGQTRSFAQNGPQGAKSHVAEDNGLPGRTTYFGYDTPPAAPHADLRRVADKDRAVKGAQKVNLNPDASAKAPSSRAPTSLALSPAGA